MATALAGAVSLPYRQNRPRAWIAGRAGRRAALRDAPHDQL